MQVKHAEEAGASGAIVYDDVYEALIIMSKPRDHAEPGIPSVFVAQKTGIVMKKLMTPGSTIVRITPVRLPTPFPRRPFMTHPVCCDGQRPSFECQTLQL